MSKSDTMFIAFPNGGVIPASITGGKDRKVAPHEAVKVPKNYGDSLVEDRFAYATDPETAKAATASRKASADDLGEREASLKKAETDVAGREAAVKTAEAALSDREAAVTKAETDLFERDAAAKKAAGGNGNG